MKLTQNEMEKYRVGWNEKCSEEARGNALLREKALSDVKYITNILIEKYDVDRIILFGSLLDESRFNAKSDIDIAVEGLKKEVYFSALGELLMKSSFEIDLIPVEDASVLLLQRLKNGKVLYEKGQDPGTQGRDQ